MCCWVCIKTKIMDFKKCLTPEEGKSSLVGHFCCRCNCRLPAGYEIRNLLRTVL